MAVPAAKITKSNNVQLSTYISCKVDDSFEVDVVERLSILKLVLTMNDAQHIAADRYQIMQLSC
jgi:hypothetical protein